MSKARRLKLMHEKIQFVEFETHQIAHNIQWMQKHLKSSNDEQAEPVVQLEMDEEEIAQDDVIYPIKKQDDTTSQLVIFVDDIQDTIDLSRNIIVLDMQPPKISKIPTTQPRVDIPPPLAKEQPVKPQLVSQDTQEEPTEQVVDHTSVQVKEKEQKEETIKMEKIVEPVKSLVKQQTNEDDDDSLGIIGPIDVDSMSASKLMKIATVMQSRAQKKRLKEQRMEAETIQNAIDILSSLLLEIAIGHLSTPIGKFGQLVTDASDQLKSLEEASQTYAKKSYRKKHGEQVMKDIATGRIALSLNKDFLRKAIEIGGRIIASISNVSFFYIDINQRRTKIEKELAKICSDYVPLQDSILAFGKTVDDLQN